jgi:hypothetical protein
MDVARGLVCPALATRRTRCAPVHDRDNPTAGGGAAAGDAAEFMLLGCGGMTSAEACKNAVDLGHGTPEAGSVGVELVVAAGSA